ncbi:MAG: terminase family protein [Candidatus Brevundimonas colombiensis]|uniref:Terminase family protein n=1 Tax=Candidatus Brevundimonas colombiensis TaxID=3121376 RepID=A0AAJ5X1Y3_9CAUL|nr:terminase family protein [Brevundimonas sp.]WEK38670.1 MAG: terminase family protein [Brevundimonas sp.]
MVLRPQAKPDADQKVWEREAAEAAFARLPKGDLLLGYQASTLELLMTGVSLVAIEKSRRIGLTWALAAYAVLKAAAQGSAGGMNAWYMGYDQEMAREFIDVCVMWARAFGIAAEEADEEILEGDGEKVQAFRLKFASGFKIVALPSVPRALRGKQGLVIIDEAAFHKDLAEVLKAAVALLMWGGQVVVVSTHDGSANPFNLLLDDIRAKKRKGEVQTITFDDAIADGLYERVRLSAEIKGRQIGSKEEWIADIRDTYGDDAAEELDCIPAAGSGSWLDPVKLSTCEHADAGKPELYTGGLVYLGRDVARRRDLSVIHAFELVGDVLWMRDRWVARAATFRAQDDAFDAIWKTRRIASAWIDQTGMGEKVVEDLQLKYGETRIVGQLLTGPNRLDLATAFKDRVENCAIRIPSLVDLRTDYRAIKKEGGVGGAVRIVDDGDVHADEFWATALACRAADTPYQPYDYRGASRSGPRPGDRQSDHVSRSRYGGRRIH